MPVKRGKVATSSSSDIKMEAAEDKQTWPASPPQALEEPMDTSSPHVIVKVVSVTLNGWPDSHVLHTRRSPLERQQEAWEIAWLNTVVSCWPVECIL